VIVNPSDVSQGSSGEVRITILNEGEDEAESVSVKIFKDSSQPFEFTEIYDFIGNLAPNGSGDAVFQFTVDPDAVIKDYLIDIEIRYVEKSSVETVKDTITIPVNVQAANYSLIIIVILIAAAIGGFLFWRNRK
jgi:hypothetical protein